MSSPNSSISHGKKSFRAFCRSSKRVGVRNKVLVIPSVICSHIVAERIAEAEDAAVCVPHDHGCGQIGADHNQTERTLLNLAHNPNISGATVVGLGCEHLQSEPFAKKIDDRGVPVRETAIQDAGGTAACVNEGIDATSEIVETTTTTERADVPIDHLTVGIVSTDLTPSTRAKADPVIGKIVDVLLDAGSHVIVAGTERLATHSNSASKRAATTDVAESIQDASERSAEQPGNARRVKRRAATVPFDDVVRTWGSASVNEFISYGERASADEGLTLVDSPSRFEEATTALAAAGASVVIHITADGVPTGHPVVPVIKVTGNETTAEALAEDIDIDARKYSPSAILDELVQVANGSRTAAEKHGLTTFAINRVGPSL